LVFFIAGGWMMFKIWFMMKLKGLDLDRALKYREGLLRWLIPFFGVRISTYGTPPKEAGLLLCNHRSYFDPAPLLKDLRAIPVGKAEIADWPVIGLGCRLSGIIFVDRTTPEGRLKARNQMNKKLKEGYSIINYPEGTTYRGPELLDPKKGMFKDAALNNYLIYPVVLEYQSPLDAWVGEETFVQHFYKRFGRRRIEMRVSYGDAIKGNDADVLFEQCKTWIKEETERLREGWYRHEDLASAKKTA
jgi:1-acyl-sn-glycerol-3-phosphate acyltransferase